MGIKLVYGNPKSQLSKINCHILIQTSLSKALHMKWPPWITSVLTRTGKNFQKLLTFHYPTIKLSKPLHTKQLLWITNKITRTGHILKKQNLTFHHPTIKKFTYHHQKDLKVKNSSTQQTDASTVTAMKETIVKETCCIVGLLR